MNRFVLVLSAVRAACILRHRPRATRPAAAERALPVRRVRRGRRARPVGRLRHDLQPFPQRGTGDRRDGPGPADHASTPRRARSDREVDFNVEYYHVGGRYSPILRQLEAPALRLDEPRHEPVRRHARRRGGGILGRIRRRRGHPALSRVALRFDARLFTRPSPSRARQIYCEPRGCTAFANGSIVRPVRRQRGLVFKF